MVISNVKSRLRHYRGARDEFEMDFKFKYVDQEQLMKVVQKVRREKILKKENDNLVSFLSRKKGICLHCKSRQIEGEERVIGSNAQEAEESVENINFDCSSDKSPISYLPTISPRTKHERNKEYHGRLNVLARRLKDLRMSILMSLDELLILSDAVVWQDDISNDSQAECEKKLNETKLRNCLCQIIKLEYPFIISLRKLHVDGHDVFSHLRVLLECHKIAFSLLKIFIRASPSILNNEKIKEKLNGSVERIIALSSVCKFITVRHGDFIKPHDFLLDDLDKRCLNLLARGKKVQLVESGRSKYTASSSRHYTGCKNTVDSKNVGKMNIDMKKFKRLAAKKFGSNRDSGRTTSKEARSKEFFLPTSLSEAESKDREGGAQDPGGIIVDTNSHHPSKKLDDEFQSTSQPQNRIEEVQAENMKMDSRLNCLDTRNKEGTMDDPDEKMGDPKEGAGEEELIDHEDDRCHTTNVNGRHEITLTKEKEISERETESTDRVETTCDTDDPAANRHPITPPPIKEDNNDDYALIAHKICNAIDRMSEKLIQECVKEVCEEADTFVNTLVDRLIIMEFT